MMKCKNLVSGEVCDYFVYGLDPNPKWFIDLGHFEKGTYVVGGVIGTKTRYWSYDEFSKKYEIIHPITESECAETPPATVDDMPYVDSGSVPSQYIDVPLVRRCKSNGKAKEGVHSGEYTYFIYGIDKTPEWFIKKFTDDLHVPVTIGLDERCYVLDCIYFMDKQEFEEYFDEITGIGVVVPPAINAAEDSDCGHPIRRREYYGENFFKCWECFKIIGQEAVVESPPPTEDILEKGREHVEAFNNRMDNLNGLGICKNKRTGTLHTFKLYDKPVDGITVISDDGEFDYFTMDFNQMFDVVKSPGVESPASTDVDASFIGDTLERPLGRKCKVKEGVDMYDYFVYGKDDLPDWFKPSRLLDEDIKYLANSINGGYVACVINEYVDSCHLYRIMIYDHFENLYVPLTDAHAEYKSMSKDEKDAVLTHGVYACPVGGYGEKSAAARFCRCRNDHSVVHEYFVYGVDHIPEWFKQEYPNEEKITARVINIDLSKDKYIVKRGDNGNVFFMSKEEFDKNLEFCNTDGEVLVLDKKISPTINTMKCRYVNPDFNKKELDYFIYGVSEIPLWFFDYRRNHVSMDSILPEKNTFVVKNKIYDVDFYNQERFCKIFEAMYNDGSWPSDIVQRNSFSSVTSTVFNNEQNIAAAGTKVHTDHWQEESEEDLSQYIELTFNTKLCKDENGEEYIYFKKGDEIPEWFKLSGSHLKFYQDYIVYYGWLDFRSITERKFNYKFKEMPGGEVTIRIPLYEEENLNIPKEIRDAKHWFEKVMNTEVFKYLVLKNIDGDGMVDMLKLYKSETNGRN